MSQELIFATNNTHKVHEISEILKDTTYIVKGLKEVGIAVDILENSDTLHGNAKLKAKYLYELTGKDSLSEDSGLFTNALHGEPGVYTAHYAGPERDNDKNINLLLEKLKPHRDRSAYFMTVICLCKNGKYQYFEGRIEGTIALQKSGEGGFGYDPIFIPDGFDQTFACLSSGIKSKISHRANAVTELVKFLEKDKG